MKNSLIRPMRATLLLAATALACPLPLAAAGAGSQAQAQTALNRAGAGLWTWTLEDILLVPKVADIALSEYGRYALYAVERADVEAGRPRTTIRLVDLAARRQRDMLSADTAKSLKPIPGTADWSGLLDLGDGLQLYRIGGTGQVSALVSNPAPVRIGKADMSLSRGGGEAPGRVGILSYDWSPDGDWLWYALLKAKPDTSRVRFDAEVEALQGRRRSQIEAEVEFYLRGPDGNSVKVMTRPSTDRMAMVAGGNIIWRGDEIRMRVETYDGTAGGAYEVRAWDRRRKIMRTLSNERDLQTTWLLLGSRGGRLATSGIGHRVELTETLPDGRRHSYGRFGFTIGDLRSAGFRRSADGRTVVAGTRSLVRPRYGLAVIGRQGVREIAGVDSLTRCGFDADLVTAVCVREGMARPPELVHVDLRSGRIDEIVRVSPRHDEIAPLEVSARTWTNRNGYEATGYVIFPRGYRTGQRYPTILVTHGSDADERFADPSNQWNYPVQLFAERGYLVVLINDPWPQQAAELMAAYQAWLRGGGPPGPEEVQRLAWINGAYSFEDAVKELAAEGLVDRERVGIAGYSRGGQMVKASVTHSKIFRAASSGDAGFLEPSGYASSRSSYDAIYGGSPLSDNLVHYRRFAPSLNADKICAAVLQQVASASPSQVEFFDAMRAEHVPTQISHYPGASAASDETHLFHIPANRLLAMRENIAWFDYWLLGKRDPNMVFPERLAEWDRMAKEAKQGCAIVPPP